MKNGKKELINRIDTIHLYDIKGASDFENDLRENLERIKDETKATKKAFVPYARQLRKIGNECLHTAIFNEIATPREIAQMLAYLECICIYRGISDNMRLEYSLWDWTKGVGFINCHKTYKEIERTLEKEIQNTPKGATRVLCFMVHIEVEKCGLPDEGGETFTIQKVALKNGKIVRQ